VALALTVALVPGIVQGGAGPSGPIIVIKTRVGPSSVTADLTALIDDEFEAEGFAARPSSVESVLGGRLPRPGILDTGVTAADLMQPLTIGYDQWAHGLFADAERTIVPALQRLNRNSALLVTDTKNLDTIFKGYASLALSQDRLGKTQQSMASMTDLIRIFRSRPPSRTEFGPPGEILYYKAYRPLEAVGTGSLFVTTGNNHAVVYVDNQIRGIGKADVSDLIPGLHRVLVQVPSTAGLQYSVEVKAHEGTTLDVDWDVETSLSVTPTWIGYVLANEVERNQEAAYAGALARRWGTRGALVVLSTYEIQGQLALVGTLYRAGGTVLRGGVAALDRDRAEQIRKLARFLSDGTTSPGVKVIAQPKEAPAVIASSSRAPGRSTLPGLLVTGAGALTVATAGIVYVTSKADDFTQPTYDDKRTPAVQVMFGGSIVLGAGAFLYLRESQETGFFTAASLGAGVGCLVSGTALYVTREGLHSQGWQRPYYRPTGALGATLGISGLVLTGAGLWLWHRERSEHSAELSAEPDARHEPVGSAPVVLIDGSQAILSWAGRF
jgi:hypothetical protein